MNSSPGLPPLSQTSVLETLFATSHTADSIDSTTGATLSRRLDMHTPSQSDGRSVIDATDLLSLTENAA